MHTVWAQRREELWSDCLVSPDVFHQMVERLAEFVVPSQHVLETEAGQRNVYLYLQGLLSHLPGKKQSPRSPRRNELPMKLIDGVFLMRHEYLAGALVELLEIGQAASSADGVLHHAPEAFDRIEMVATGGR